MKKLFVVFFILLFSYAHAQEGQKPTLAIADFEGKDKELSVGITEIFTTDLSKSKLLSVVERNQIEKAAKEAGLGMSGFVDESTAAKVGKLAGAKKVIVGSYLDVEGKVILNARMVDVETGKVERALNREGDKANLYFLVHQLAQDFHKSLTGKWIPELITDDIAKTPEGKLEILKQIDPALFLSNPKSKLKVDVWVNKKGEASYKQEESMTVSFRADADCYVTVFNMDSEGKINLLFPNSYTVDNKVQKGKVYTIPQKGADYEFAVSGMSGEEQIVAIATKEPLELVKDMESLVKKEFMPEVSKTSSDFVSRSVKIKLKGSPEENWNAARVKFYLDEK